MIPSLSPAMVTQFLSYSLLVSTPQSTNTLICCNNDFNMNKSSNLLIQCSSLGSLCLNDQNSLILSFPSNDSVNLILRSFCIQPWILIVDDTSHSVLVCVCSELSWLSETPAQPGTRFSPKFVPMERPWTCLSVGIRFVRWPFPICFHRGTIVRVSLPSSRPLHSSLSHDPRMGRHWPADRPQKQQILCSFKRQAGLFTVIIALLLSLVVFELAHLFYICQHILA